MDKQINIKILGTCGSGKTTIATLISDALLANGITNCHIVDEDGSLDNRAKQGLCIQALKDLKVNIQTVQVARKSL